MRSNLSVFFLKNGLKEEELGPVPFLSERNGPCVHTRHREGCLVDTGQEVLHQGNRILMQMTGFTVQTLRNTFHAEMIP